MAGVRGGADPAAPAPGWPGAVLYGGLVLVELKLLL